MSFYQSLHLLNCKNFNQNIFELSMIRKERTYWQFIGIMLKKLLGLSHQSFHFSFISSIFCSGHVYLYVETWEILMHVVNIQYSKHHYYGDKNNLGVGPWQYTDFSMLTHKRGCMLSSEQKCPTKFQMFWIISTCYVSFQMLWITWVCISGYQQPN